MTQTPHLGFPLAGLLAEPAGAVRHFELDRVAIHLDDDLDLAEPISGSLEVGRTNRGVFVHAQITAALTSACSRCLGPTVIPLALTIREEVLLSVDPLTGQAVDRAAEPEVARLTDHHELDLEPILREAVSMAEPIAPLCRPDCLGLCIECGERMDGHPGHELDDVDPRLAALRGFRVDADSQNE